MTCALANGEMNWGVVVTIVMKQHKISGMKSQTGMVKAKVEVVDWTT